MYQSLTEPGQLVGTPETDLLVGSPGNDQIFGIALFRHFGERKIKGKI